MKTSMKINYFDNSHLLTLCFRHLKTIKMNQGRARGLSSVESNAPITSLAYDVATDTLYTGHNCLSHSFIIKFRVNGEKLLEIMRG